MPTQQIPTWWKKMKLGEVVEITSSKRIYLKDYVDNWIPFYRWKEIIKLNNWENITEPLYISEQKYLDLKNKYWAPSEWDLLLTSVWTIWVPYIVKKTDKFYFKDWNLLWFRNFKKDIIHNKYLYYVFSSFYWQELLNSILIGSSQKALTIVWLKSLGILLPPLPIQKKIASILSAYDDLIENNNKRIKILEQMGKAIFDDMMKQAKEKGELEEVKVGEIVEKISKKYKEEMHKNLPLLDLARIPRKNFNIQSFWKSDELKTWRIIFKKYDILFWSIRPYFHKVVYAPFKWITNVSVFVLRPKKDYLFSFALYTLFSDEIINFASKASWWTKMPVIKWDVLKEKTIKIPPQQTLQNFNNQVKPILDEILNLQLQNQSLKQTRDLLIPRLVSGKLDVEEIEINM